MKLFNTVLSQPKNLMKTPNHLSGPPGLRLSIDCPLERVMHFKASQTQPETLEQFNPGVGMIGHLYADIWISMLNDADTTIPEALEEYEVEWGNGYTTHIDAIKTEGKHQGVYEIKTTSSDRLSILKTTRNQMHRQMYSCKLKEPDLLNYDWVNVVIGKAGNQSGWIGDRHVVAFDSEAEEYAEQDRSLTMELQSFVESGLATLDDYHELGSYCMCGRCIPVEPTVLDDDSINELVSDFLILKQPLDAAKKAFESSDAKDKIITSLGPGSYETLSGIKFTVTKNKQLRIK